MRRSQRTILVLCSLFGCACTTGDVLVPVTPTPGTATITEKPVTKVDMLFVIDNSPSMTPKQEELKTRIPVLLDALKAAQQNPISYHIGVVTSDLGSGSYTLGQGQCHPGGDGGKLQPIGAAAAAGCLPPTGGVNFIDFDEISNSNNLPPGQDLNKTFTCMMSVGDKGCGFESPLEAAYRALHDVPAENHDFLRADALLVVVFLTDEDDCSAPPDTDLFDPENHDYGALLSYRCTNYSIACGSPPALMPYGDSGGPLSDCHDADPSVNKLIPVAKYINFFTKPASAGGIKDDPLDVILLDISGPDDLVQSILANPATAVQYTECGGPISQTCAAVLQHSCASQSNQEFFGDPAVRLRQVVNSVRHGGSASICDDSYQPAMMNLANVMLAQESGRGCIGLPFADPTNPVCTVDDVTTNADGTTTSQPIPRCDQSGGQLPCWELRARSLSECRAVCLNPGDPGQHFSLEVNRTQPQPVNVATHATCQVLQVPPLSTGELPTCGAPL